MSNNTLVQLIYGALKSQKNEQRKLAQKQIIDIRQSNPNEFFFQCASLLVNQKQDDFIRQSASTLIVSSIRAKCNNVYFWDILQPNTRQSVKNQMLNTLVDPNSMIMKSGANVISHIAAIQIPRNEWLDLVDILAQNTGYSDVNVRKASIITIGSICQQLNQAAVKIQPRACQQFLGGILVGIQQKDDASIIQQSMKALRNSLSFLTPILGQQTYRNEVFRIIYQKIKISNQDHLPYEALFQFCKNCYQYLHPYLQLIIQMVTVHLKQKNDNTISALQLLDTIGSEYLSRTQDAQDRTNISKNNLQNYLLPLQADILTQIMKCLLIQNKRQLEFSELRNSAAKTLSTFASIGNRQTVDIIANGAAVCLQEQNLGRQQATAVLLSTLCENPDRQYVVQMITNAFEHVLNLLNSNTQIVVLNTLNGFISISQFFPFIFYNHPNVTTIINKLFQLINPQKPTITMAIFMIFKNITQNIEPNCVFLRQPSILLTRIVNWYEQFLDDFEGPSKDYAQKSVFIIMNCLVKLKNRQIILFMIEFLMNKYYFYYDRQVSDQSLRLSSIASIVHTSILALQNMIPQEGLINNLCNLIDKHLNVFGIQQQGLNMISAMAITFNKAFQPRTEKYWKYLEGGLDLISQPRTFKAALSSIGDFSRVYAETFIAKELHILDKLLILIHEGFDRQIKLNILVCIADLVLGVGQSADAYLKRIIQMTDICFQAVYQLSNNPNQRQYVQQLKRSLIDMYACLTFSINGNQHRAKSQLLFNHFPYVATFVVRTCQRSQNPTIDYVKICLYLLFDSATFYSRQKQYYKNTFKNILQSKQVENLVKILQNFKQKDDIRQLQSLIQQRYDGM